MPPTPATQVSENNPGMVYANMTLDEMMQFSQWTPLVSGRETPQSSHRGQINLDFNDTTVNCVNGYFQEGYWSSLPKSDPQSSHGGHSSDMRMLFNGMNSAPSTSGSTEFYNTVQNVHYALEAHHYQQFPPQPFDPFYYGDQPNAMPPTQLDKMNQFFQVAPLESDREFPQSDPQSSHHGQIKLFFDFNDMKDNGVYPYFQEAHSGFDGIFLSQSDPQSSQGGHLKPIQDSSDMRFSLYTLSRSRAASSV